MHTRTRFVVTLSLATSVLLGAWAMAQTSIAPERFTAVAVSASNVATGVGTVVITVDRWTTDAERTRLVNVLREKGPRALLDELTDIRAVGRIRTPDALGYNLHYAHQTPRPDGGRRIVIATDRPISFWEQWYRPRTVDYPFTIVQMEFGAEGRGTGTISYATKIRAYDTVIELEDFASSPIMLNDVRAEKVD
jgi:hypothetical protein